MNGIGLLDVTTVFEQEKTTTQVEGTILNDFESINDHHVKGYEIHMGTTVLGEGLSPLIQVNKKLGETVELYDGAVNHDKTVFGTYIHGIFDEVNFSRAFINMIREQKGFNAIDEKAIDSFEAFKDNEYNKLAKILRESLDIDRIYELIRGF
jgi:adenosylcobyric acid synthase